MIDIEHLRVEKSGKTICSANCLQVAEGERIGIVGPNGSGKTTLLRVLSGIESNFSGNIRVDVPRRERVYVHQSPYMLRGTVLFNVTYGLSQIGMARDECQRSAHWWLELMGIAHLVRSRADLLSGGEKRRVALARAMVRTPRLLLLDEPLADLDALGTAAVAQAVHELTQTTIIVTSPTGLRPPLATREFKLSSE